MVALCRKVWVPSRAPEKFPVCPCKESGEVAQDDAGKDSGGSGPAVTDRPSADPACTRSPWLGRSALPGDGDLAARVADSGDAAVRRRPPARLPDRRDPGRRQDHVRPTTVAARLLGRRIVDRVTIVAPTEHLKLQWAGAAARAGMPIDPTYAAGKGKTSQEYVGIAVTYAGVATNPLCDADPHRAVSRPWSSSTRCTTPGTRSRGGASARRSSPPPAGWR